MLSFRQFFIKYVYICKSRLVLSSRLSAVILTLYKPLSNLVESDVPNEESILIWRVSVSCVRVRGESRFLGVSTACIPGDDWVSSACFHSHPLTLSAVSFAPPLLYIYFLFYCLVFFIYLWCLKLKEKKSVLVLLVCLSWRINFEFLQSFFLYILCFKYHL